METLKEKEFEIVSNALGDRKIFFKEDVKEAVLEFKKELFNLYKPFATENTQRIKIEEKFDKIFGDFNK